MLIKFKKKGNEGLYRIKSEKINFNGEVNHVDTIKTCSGSKFWN